MGGWSPVCSGGVFYPSTGMCLALRHAVERDASRQAAHDVLDSMAKGSRPVRENRPGPEPAKFLS